MARHKVEMKLLLDHREEQRGLQHGEGCANTHSRTTTKRKIGKSRNFSGADGIFAPAFGVECPRIGEESWIALRQCLKDENVGAGEHAVAANLAVRESTPSNAPNGGIEPHRFLD